MESKLYLDYIGSIAYNPIHLVYYYNSNILILRGQTTVDSQVDFFINNVKATQVTSGTDGSYIINHNLANGTYAIKVQQGGAAISFVLNVDNTSQSFPSFIKTLLGL